jgi:UDP-3-O-[3-hydroxymyristoyl] glucosamine N-acyltransferase
MEFSAQSIAELLKGTVEGDPNVVVNNVSKIEEGKPGTLAFLANPKYTNYIYSTDASIVLVNNDFKAEKEIKATLIRVDNAYESFATLLEFYNSQRHHKSGIDEQTHIDETATYGDHLYLGAFSYIGKHAKIGNNVKIHPQCFIGDNVTIKDNVTLFPGVKVYHDCILGNHVTIHAGTIVGSDGFGFAPSNTNDYKKIPQIGNVILEDYVELGANVTVDRATMGSTIIRKGVKLDNLVQVAHNVEIGENVVMAAQGGIAGSTKIGKNCMFGGQIAIANHITIADETKAAARSGIANSIKVEGTTVMGAPAFDIGQYRKAYIVFSKLPDMRKQIFQMEKEIAELKKKLEE